MTSIPCNSTYKGLRLILIPPFVAKVLLDLPTLTCNKALAATLEAITTFKKENKPSSSPAATAAAKPTVKIVKEEMES
jgi:hypothetical protein